MIAHLTQRVQHVGPRLMKPLGSRIGRQLHLECPCRFSGEMTRKILPRFCSRSRGIAQGSVFPDPVPAITVPSNPRVSAPVRSICQSCDVTDDGAQDGNRGGERAPGNLRVAAFFFFARAPESSLYERALHGSQQSVVSRK